MRFIEKVSYQCGLRVLIISTAFMAFFMGVVLPFEARAFSNATNNVSEPDTQFFYTGDWLYDIANQLGNEGRYFYIISRLRFDIIWPIVYTFFFFVLLSITWKNLSGRKYIVLLPLLAFIFDLVENTLVSIVFAMYPRQILWIASMAGLCTMMKWIIIFTTIIGLIIGIIRLLVREYHQRQSS